MGRRINQNNPTSKSIHVEINVPKMRQLHRNNNSKATDKSYQSIEWTSNRRDTEPISDNYNIHGANRNDKYDIEVTDVD